jgi:hypothetical protein
MAPANNGPEQVSPKAPQQQIGVDPTAREALMLIFSSEGSYLQELLLTEVL